MASSRATSAAAAPTCGASAPAHPPRPARPPPSGCFQHESGRDGRYGKQIQTAILGGTQTFRMATDGEPLRLQPTAGGGDDSPRAEGPDQDGEPLISPLPRSSRADDPHDPHNLRERFVKPQALKFRTALAEIHGGKKRSHWSWFVLPVAPWIVDGVERGSPTNQYYALRTDEQAVAYLQFASGVLRRNYLEILAAIEAQLEMGVTLRLLMGVMDDPKARSSFGLFERIAASVGDDELRVTCARVLARIAATDRAAPSPAVSAATAPPPPPLPARSAAKAPSAKGKHPPPPPPPQTKGKHAASAPPPPPPPPMTSKGKHKQAVPAPPPLPVSAKAGAAAGDGRPPPPAVRVAPSKQVDWRTKRAEQV